MAKELIARGQATLTTQQDAYTISQSLSEYVFPSTFDGKITEASSIIIEIKVTQNDVALTAFAIGSIAKPAGFLSVSVNNATKSITLSVAAATTNLADHGKLDIPVIIAATTYHLSFVWSKAKAGAAGIDANMLDWVKEWNSGKTQIGESTIITPKLFAGVKNADGTLTGTAVGRYVISSKTASGALSTETIDGISGFRNGYKTFFLDNGGNIQLGRGDQYIKYDASAGKVEFGAGVSLLWAGATYIDKNGIFTGTLCASIINALHLDASQITSGKIKAEYIDVASVITAGNIEALTLNVVRGKIGGWSIDADSIFRGVKNNNSGTFTPTLGDITLGSNGLRGRMWSLDSSGAGAIAGGNIRWDTAGKVAFDKTVTVAWQNGIDTTSELARAMAYGRMLYRDPTFSQGTNSVNLYNNLGNGALTLSRVSNPQAPNDSHQVLEISTTGVTTPGLGGFFFGNLSSPGKIFITRIIAKIPEGYGIFWASNAIGKDGFGKWLTTNEGTGKWEEYIFKVVCGNEGSFGGTNCFYLSPILSSTLPLVWQIAYATVFDVTSAEKLTTTIDVNGIYTGSITAGQITTGSLAADRIAAGSIKAEKLDAASIKASIINADYISGLNCAFTQGKIGGWIIGEETISSGPLVLDSAKRRLVVSHSGANQISGQRVQIYYSSDSDFGIYATDVVGACVFQLGSINRIAGWNISNLSISKGNVELSADGSITNTSKWKLNNDGSGQLATGNISWNAAGTVTFSSAVSLNWSTPIGIITSALGGATYPKLTNISATGIYTGTLTASQVNAVSIDAGSIKTGTLSADRIAAGSIKAEKLDAASIQANIINVNYINGLTCMFTKGKIGGWTIGVDNITSGSIGAVDAMSIQLRTTSAGSGYWYDGSYRPLGLSMIWHQSANAGHIVFGQIAATGISVRSGFIGIQMMSWDSREYFCLSANSQISGAKEVYNRIAGWAFDHDHIWKNNVSLGADGSIQNSTKWRLNNDGSGSVASGNISWDASGNVVFSDAVSLLWKNDVQSALSNGQIYVRGTGRDRTNRMVMVNGQSIVDNNLEGLQLTVLRRDDLSVVSNVRYDTYSISGEENKMCDALTQIGSDCIIIVTSFGLSSISKKLGLALQKCGSPQLYYSDDIPLALIGIPGIEKNKGLMAYSTDNVTWAELAVSVICGIPQGINANATQKTYINGDGLYTGNISATQVRVDSALVVGGKSYNGSISVRDAADSVIVTLDRSGITAIGGRIGGWLITDETICAAEPDSGHRVTLTSSGYLYNDNPNTGVDYWGLKSDGSATFGYGKISFENTGAGFVANGNLSWDANGNLSAKNGSFDNVIINGTIRNAFILNDSTIHIGGSDPQMNFNKYDHVVAVGSGGFVEDIPLPWTLDHSGRKVCLVNYKWGNNTTVGFMDISAPAGKYFYEDGIAKPSIRFSRELVELLGYGDNTTFFGWIVVNRKDLMTTKQYGSYQKILAQGTYTVSSSLGTSIYYKTFDGSKITVSRTGKGIYRVYLPTNWSLGGLYMVMLSGIFSNPDNTPIFATLRTKSTFYFDVQTSDDQTPNDGSFSFQVISTADWSI